MTVVILSKTSSNLIPCVAAVRQHEPDARIVVVDDGLESVPTGVQVVNGVKPFVFARNANIGINASGSEVEITTIGMDHREFIGGPPDDVILLNDDALLRTPRGFTVMFDELRAHPDYGLVGATCNNVGNTNQWPRGEGFRYEPRMVCFVCVAIPRSTIERVGLLDERFTGYGHDDDDYCLRVRVAGLKVGITDNCYVDHGQLTSTFRGKGHCDLSHNQAIFAAKWGSMR